MEPGYGRAANLSYGARTSVRSAGQPCREESMYLGNICTFHARHGVLSRLRVLLRDPAVYAPATTGCPLECAHRAALYAPTTPCAPTASHCPPILSFYFTSLSR